jgi:hypothetical protein
MSLDFGTQRIGYDYAFETTIEDGAGAKIDLTGAAVTVALQASEGGPSLAGLDVEILNARGGAIRVTSPRDTITGAGLGPGRYLVVPTIVDSLGRHLDATGGDDWSLTLVGGVGTEAVASAGYTVAKAAARLVRKRRKWLAAVGMDTNPGAGNEDAADALIGAMEWLESGLNDPGRIADGDLAGMTAARWAELIDVADLRLMEAILGNADEVTSSTDNRKKAATDFAMWVQGEIKAKRDELRRRYGYGLGSLTAGSIGLGFQSGDPGCGES